MAAQDLPIPVRRLTPLSGAFRWPAQVTLASPTAADLVPLGQLAADLARLGIRAGIARNAFGPATLRIVRDKSVAGREAYRLAIGPKGIEIAASADAGAYYAVQTLRDLVAVHGRAVPACRIDDRPDFARRGIYHDCSRGKVPTLATLKALIEQIARWKVNELQLYVENVFTFQRHPDIGRGYSPFTPEDLLEVQEHCKRHHVAFVGSLASFGHMEKVLQLPAYQKLGELQGWAGWPGGTTFCPGDPGSIRLLAELYEEFLPLFEAEDFNVCGDEPWELGKGRSKKAAERIGVGRVYLEFLKKIHRLCEKHGKRMNAWADIVLDHAELLGEWPKDIVMLNWEYSPDGGRIPRTKEIAAAGLPLVVCPGTNAWNSHGCRLDMGMRNIRRFAAEGLKCGAEGCLNTDWGDNGHRNMLAISLHNFAYGAAQSWNHGVACNEGFTRRFTDTFCRHTFGLADGRLAKCIRTLGGVSETVGFPDSNGTPLYSVFIEPLKRLRLADNWWSKHLDSIKPADLAARRDALLALKWPAPLSATTAVMAKTFAEFAVATDLDAVACDRGAVVKMVREGKTPPAGLLKRLVAETKTVAGELERVWLLGNRPSRLRDNLKGMRRGIGEYKRLLRS